MSTASRRAWLLGLLLALRAGPASAHPTALGDARVELAHDAAVVVSLRIGAHALAPGLEEEAAHQLLAARLRLEGAARATWLAELRAWTVGRVTLRGAGGPVPLSADLPELGSDPGEPLELTLRGRVDPAEKTLTFQADPSLGPLLLTVRRARMGELARLTLEPGEASPPVSLAAGPGESEARPRAGVAAFVVIGFRHILPAGLDHVLFVLGLYLLGGGLRSLLWQVTAFTLAHTATLAAATFGVVRLSPDVVEPLIALSLVYVAVEDLVVGRLRPWRPLVVFAFGLLHGLGFAEALGDLDLPPGDRVRALLGFNLGVEAGQLAVVAGAAAVLGPWRHRRWYRPFAVVPLCLGIAAAGLVWAALRLT